MAEVRVLNETRSLYVQDSSPPVTSWYCVIPSAHALRTAPPAASPGTLKSPRPSFVMRRNLAIRECSGPNLARRPVLGLPPVPGGPPVAGVQKRGAPASGAPRFWTAPQRSPAVLDWTALRANAAAPERGIAEVRQWNDVEFEPAARRSRVEGPDRCRSARRQSRIRRLRRVEPAKTGPGAGAVTIPRRPRRPPWPAGGQIRNLDRPR